jgi:hypothetical protein
MKEHIGSEDWRLLCELASKEQNSEKLRELIDKVIHALDECNQQSPENAPKIRVGRIVMPAPAETNLYF